MGVLSKFERREKEEELENGWSLSKMSASNETKRNKNREWTSRGGTFTRLAKRLET